jgi:hypothetical protein
MSCISPVVLIKPTNARECSCAIGTIGRGALATLPQDAEQQKERAQRERIKEPRTWAVFVLRWLQPGWSLKASAAAAGDRKPDTEGPAAGEPNPVTAGAGASILRQ